MTTAPGVWSLTVATQAHLEGDEWVATCPLLGVASQGATEDEAYDALREALVLFFEVCLERGTFWSVLEKKGLAPSAMGVVSSERPSPEPGGMQIPLYLLPESGAQASVL